MKLTQHSSPRVSKARVRRAAPMGLALIELLVCSSICAMMLTATAVAFRASVMAYRDNSDRNILLSSGRIAMRQLIYEIRAGDSFAPALDTAMPSIGGQFAGGQVTEGIGITICKSKPDHDEPNIVPSDPRTFVNLTWTFDAPNSQVTRQRTVLNSGTTITTMAGFVQDFKVRMEPVATTPTTFTLQRAIVTIKLQNVDINGKMIFNQGNGQAVERIIDAAVPRKNFAGL